MSSQYEERLKVWGLTTLKERRKRGDAIQMYKYANKLEFINWHKEPKFAQLRETSDRECRKTEEDGLNSEGDVSIKK